jgi:hypothetical protein
MASSWYLTVTRSHPAVISTALRPSFSRSVQRGRDGHGLNNPAGLAGVTGTDSTTPRTGGGRAHAAVDRFAGGLGLAYVRCDEAAFVRSKFGPLVWTRVPKFGPVGLGLCVGDPKSPDLKLGDLHSSYTIAVLPAQALSRRPSASVDSGMPMVWPTIWELCKTLRLPQLSHILTQKKSPPASPSPTSSPLHQIEASSGPAGETSSVGFARPPASRSPRQRPHAGPTLASAPSMNGFEDV